MIQEVATLPSGSKLSMQVAPWGTAGQLRRQFALELKAVNLDFSSDVVRGFMAAAATGNPAVLLQAVGGTDLNVLKNLVMQLGGSEQFEEIIFDCLRVCTLNGIKASKDVFESEDARPDYYPAVWEVLKLNLRPFFKSLLSTLPSPSSPKAAPQK